MMTSKILGDAGLEGAYDALGFSPLDLHLSIPFTGQAGSTIPGAYL
jgi:hypothetical protein